MRAGAHLQFPFIQGDLLPYNLQLRCTLQELDFDLLFNLLSLFQLRDVADADLDPVDDRGGRDGGGGHDGHDGGRRCHQQQGGHLLLILIPE